MSIFANATLKELGKLLAGADSVLLFSHVNPDPDAIGSAMALCLALRRQGVRSFVVLDEPVPKYLRFLEEGLEEAEETGAGLCGSPLTTDPDVIPDPEISLCIDCSEDYRIGGRRASFARGEVTAAIDHHQAKECDRDYYYIDNEAAACCQIVYQMMREMDWPLDRKSAELLYTGLNGDTGCFMHSNTTARVHRMAAELLEFGVDINKVNVNLYQSKDLREVRLESRILQHLELFADGKAVISAASQEDYDACGAGPEHAGQVIDQLRVIDGVEIAAFLRQDGEKVRGTMRSKTAGNVARIAGEFGGGGHIKAAGFTSELPMEELYPRLQGAIAAEIRRMDGAGEASRGVR